MENKYVNCRNLYGKYTKVDVKKLSFRPGVYGVLIKNGQVLLSKQWDGYDFPGGGVKIHETVDTALAREFWEETGLKVKRGEVVSCESCFYTTLFSRKHINSISMYYLVRKVSGKLSIDNIEESEKHYLGMPEWIPLERINKIKFYNSVDSIKIIKQAIKLLSK